MVSLCVIKSWGRLGLAAVTRNTDDMSRLSLNAYLLAGRPKCK